MNISDSKLADDHTHESYTRNCHQHTSPRSQTRFEISLPHCISPNVSHQNHQEVVNVDTETNTDYPLTVHPIPKVKNETKVTIQETSENTDKDTLRSLFEESFTGDCCVVKSVIMLKDAAIAGYASLKERGFKSSQERGGIHANKRYYATSTLRPNRRSRGSNTNPLDATTGTIESETDLALHEEGYVAFISYAHGGSPQQARKLYKTLTDMGLDVWIDYRHLKGGNHIQNKICEAIEKSKKIICVVDSVYMSKVAGGFGAEDTCMFEFEYAKTHKGFDNMLAVVTDGDLLEDKKRWVGPLHSLLQRVYLSYTSDDELDDCANQIRLELI